MNFYVKFININFITYTRNYRIITLSKKNRKKTVLTNFNLLLKKKFFFFRSLITGVGKLRPAGQLRPTKGKSAAREHVIILNGMRPSKEKSAARDHVNKPDEQNYFFGKVM